MDKVKVLRTIYWIIVVFLISIFYFSLRYAGDQAMEYTLLALVFWAAAFGLNRYIRKIKSEEEEE